MCVCVCVCVCEREREERERERESLPKSHDYPVFTLVIRQVYYAQGYCQTQCLIDIFHLISFPEITAIIDWALKPVIFLDI